MNRHVFHSLLAMDSNNRGYNAGILNLPQTGGVGAASILTDSSILKNSSGDRTDIPQGFYAIAYDWQGKTVVSYRGTDLSDAANVGDEGSYENVSEYVRDLIRKDMERVERVRFNA